MRTASFLLILALALACPRAGFAQSGGGFQIPWASIGAGGGAAAGGGFALSGSVSGPGGSPVSGGTFVLQGGWGGPASVLDANGPQAPTAFAWLPASPNPFSHRTSIGFELPRVGHVRLAAYDVRGRQVRSFVDDTLAPGRHHLEWDGTDDAGIRLSSGVYFLRLDAGDVHSASRVALVH